MAPAAAAADPIARTAPLYQRVRNVIPAIEWAGFAGDIAAILDLKRERNAVCDASNNRVARDVIQDSLDLLRVTRTCPDR